MKAATKDPSELAQCTELANEIIAACKTVKSMGIKIQTRGMGQISDDGKVIAMCPMMAFEFIRGNSVISNTKLYFSGHNSLRFANESKCAVNIGIREHFYEYIDSFGEVRKNIDKELKSADLKQTGYIVAQRVVKALKI